MTRHMGSTLATINDRLELRYGSASSIRTAAGCLRRWHWEKVSKKTTPQTKSQILGSQVHAEIESYLQHGSLPLGPIAMAGLTAGILPNPDSDLLVEHPIATLEGGTIKAHVMIDGLPIVGFIDLVDRETWSIVDHKTLSDKRYAKTPDDLTNDLQMLTYAAAIGREFDRNQVAIAHHNYLTRGTPRAWAVGAMVDTREALDKVTEIATPTIRQIRSMLPVLDSNDVPANLDQCGAYGGCPHREYCNGYTQKQLQSLGFTEGETNMRFNTTELQREMLNLKQAERRNDGPIVKAYMDAIQRKAGCVPPLVGALATAYTTELGSPADATEGTGYLAKVDPAVETLDDLKILASELEVGQVIVPSVPTVSQPIVQVVPPDAPASNPAQADVPPLKRGRGRPRKENALPSDTVADVITAVETKTHVIETPRVTETKNQNRFEIGFEPILRVYVDCMPVDSTNITNLAEYCTRLVSTLCSKAGVEDPRIAPKDSQLAYGGWKALIGALVKMSPPAPGSYFLDTKGNDFHEVIANALAPLATVCVRGIR